MYILIMYLYLYTMFLMLAFSIFNYFYEIYIERKERKVKVRMKSEILTEIESLRRNSYLTKQHSEFLEKNLIKPKKLLIFEQSLSSLEQNHNLIEYKSAIESLIYKTLLEYRKKQNIEKSMFAWFIAEQSKGVWEKDEIYSELITYLVETDIYLIENVLLCLYKQKNPKHIVDALKLISNLDINHHEKLIQDGLLLYDNPSEDLPKILFANKNLFSLDINLGIIGFITYKSNQFGEEFYKLLNKENLNLEMQIRIIRYFGKHYYPSVEFKLISFLQHQQEIIRSVTAKSLRNYKSEEVVKNLMKAMSDSDWYVRYNSTESLIILNTFNENPSLISDLKDNYAREMFEFQMTKLKERSI